MLKKQEILDKTDNGLQVFKHYLNIDFKIGTNFKNPLYDDHNASCNIYFDKGKQIYRMKDFGNDDYSGDCFFFVGKLLNLSCQNAMDFVQILKTINQDLHLGLDSETHDIVPPTNQISKPKNPQTQTAKPYEYIPQTLTEIELNYWQSQGIDRNTLNRYSVVSLALYKSENKENKPFSIQSSKQEPMFAYKHQDFVKIYRPKSKMRFLYGGIIPETYCFGFKQLPAKGDVLFITGGEKDVMCLASKGFYAICFNSETAHIPIEIIAKLSYRFKHLVLLFDMDETGLKASKKQQEQLKDFEVKRLLLPLPGTKKEKDITDYFRLGYTAKDLRNLFLSHLEQLYHQTLSALSSCEINLKNPPPKAEVLVSVKGVPLGTQGNIFCITGSEGTGKSNYIASMIAGSLQTKNQNEIDTLGLEITPNYNQDAILYYDTEQSEVQLFKNVNNLLRRVNLKEKPDYFRAYCLTGMSRSERLLSIVQSIDLFYYRYGAVRMIVIDGIADLVKGANDETECVAVVEELYRLAGIYNTCIVTVLHFIPNRLKLRGHLGSELQRKSATILSIEKEENSEISVVKALKVRDGSPLDVPLMQFKWDKELKMHTYLGEKSKKERDKRKTKDLETVAKEIFEKKSSWNYGDLCTELQSFMEVKERTAKNYIKYMREKEIVFFKTAKPKISGRILFFQEVIKLETHSPENIEQQLKFYDNQIIDYHNRLVKNKLYDYFILDRKDIDTIYFLRKNTFLDNRDYGFFLK